MSRYNHFAPLKYVPINFSTLKDGDKFRMAKFKGKIRRYLIMVKTGDLTYMELKSKIEHTLHNSDITVYKYEQ